MGGGKDFTYSRHEEHAFALLSIDYVWVTKNKRQSKGIKQQGPPRAALGAGPETTGNNF